MAPVRQAQGRRRTFLEIDAAARADERVGLARMAEAHAARVRAAVERGRMGAEEGAALIDRIAAFAGSAAAGLHLETPDTIATRHAVRAAFARAGLQSGEDA